MLLQQTPDKKIQKKRGSLSRVKSTPKEEGGGDKSELPKMLLLSTSVRTLYILPEAEVPGKLNLCIAQLFFLSTNKPNLYNSTYCFNLNFNQKTQLVLN